jgi:hypothetical protein
MRFHVSTATSMNVPCRLVETERCFRDAYATASIITMNYKLF